MTMDETVKFILQNKDSLNPAVLKTVLASIESDEEEEENESIEAPVENSISEGPTNGSTEEPSTL